MSEVQLTQEEANARHVRYKDYVACDLAFIDCKRSGSHLKENYAIIGPGVTSNREQVINLPEPHGFALGAASMPHGVTNNLHIHYTAEVFLNYRGNWCFRWGSDGKEGEYFANPGDVISMPTWIFRGFTNNGADKGWLFTILGGDDTGGVLWHPEIIREARDYGLYINTDNVLIDTGRGDPKPAPSELIEPLCQEDIDGLPHFTAQQMMSRVVKAEERDWRPAFLDQNIDGCGAQIAPVIGAGMTQNREHQAKISSPHGFTTEWLRLETGQRLSKFWLPEKMVIIVYNGSINMRLCDHRPIEVTLGKWDTYSIPGGVWRSLENITSEMFDCIVILPGDHRKWPRFAQNVVHDALRGGLGLDPNGYCAASHLLPKHTFVKNWSDAFKSA